MPGIAVFENATGVTGSGGFIGSHVSAALGREAAGRTVQADVTDRPMLEELARVHTIRSLIHLASAGSVITEMGAIPRMLGVTVGGLVNMVQAFSPERVVFSSSCAVYGNTPEAGAEATLAAARPLGAYGLAKLMAERTLEQWCRQESTTAVSLRLSNVIGPGCPGLVRYLVRHAIQHPDGRVPAQMRGGGKIVRDYVPVGYAVSIMEQALGVPLGPGLHIFNVGSGCILSNGQVAEIVQACLAERGLQLKVQFQPQPDPVEAAYSRLRVEATEERFERTPPNEGEVLETIRASTFAAFTRWAEEREKQVVSNAL